MSLDHLPSYQDSSEDSREHFHHSLLLLVANLDHLSDILMTSVKEPRAVKWHAREVDTLMDYLVEHQQIPNLMYTYVQCCTDVTALWQGPPLCRAHHSGYRPHS